MTFTTEELEMLLQMIDAVSVKGSDIEEVAALRKKVREAISDGA